MHITFNFSKKYGKTEPIDVHTISELFDVIRHYYVTFKSENVYMIEQLDINEDYESLKDKICTFAKVWQCSFDKCNYDYDALAFYQSFFEKYGKRYGLLNEFHENGIC